MTTQILGQVVKHGWLRSQKLCVVVCIAALGVVGCGSSDGRVAKKSVENSVESIDTDDDPVIDESVIVEGELEGISDDAALNNELSGGAAVRIVQQPVSEMVTEGANIELQVVAESEEGLRYQWFLNGELLSGETQPQLQLSGITEAQSGEYHCVVSSESTSETSSSASLVVASTAVSSTAQVIWAEPTSRIDGAGLNGEISGYEVYYSEAQNGEKVLLDSVSADVVDEGGRLSYTVEELSVGTHYFSVVTVDANGLKSDFSSMLAITFN